MNAIRILVAEAEGSVPREAGAVMWVWTDGIDGTIGGGSLEHEAIAAARKMLADDLPDWHRELRAYPLGPALGQCCGGMVRVLFEVVAPHSNQAPDSHLFPFSHREQVANRRMWGTGASGCHAYVPQLGSMYHSSDVQFFCASAQERHLLPKGEGSGAPPPAPGVVVKAIASDEPPTLIHDRHHTGDLPLPVLRAVRAMLSGERPRATLVIRGHKGAADYVIEPEAALPHLLYLYGAGHVGRAVVRALADLPFAVTWVDVAADRFPKPLPSNATPIVATDPAAVAAAAPSEALHLIMTFSHALDLSITHAVLAKKFAWAGLIGSATKRARFKKRLREAGIADAALTRLACPIGIGGITGKEPAMIAISVAAQLAAWASSHTAALTQKDRQHG